MISIEILDEIKIVQEITERKRTQYNQCVINTYKTSIRLTVFSHFHELVDYVQHHNKRGLC